MESLVTGCVALSDFIREIAVYSAFKKESLPKIEKSRSIFTRSLSGRLIGEPDFPLDTRMAYR
jgi:hypothetical protein